MSDTERFDKAASTWDQVDRRVLLARGVTAAMTARLPFSPAWNVLDFGCGTGLVTLALAPLVGAITGADTSTGMLETLAAKAQSAEVPVHLVHLGTDSGTGLGAELGGPYDLIASSMTLHHVPDVPGLFQAFAQQLKPGGQVALADLEEEDGTFHDDATGVHHPGFSRALIQAWLEEAGFQAVRVETAFVTAKGAVDYPVFLATAQRA